MATCTMSSQTSISAVYPPGIPALPKFHVVQLPEEPFLRIISELVFQPPLR